jgi:hypothetical protein
MKVQSPSDYSRQGGLIRSAPLPSACAFASQRPVPTPSLLNAACAMVGWRSERNSHGHLRVRHAGAWRHSAARSLSAVADGNIYNGFWVNFQLNSHLRDVRATIRIIDQIKILGS